MKNNLIPQIRGPSSASILDGIILRNPFLAAENEISNPESTPVSDVRQENIRASEKILRVVGYEEMTAANSNLFRKTACAAWLGHTNVEIDLSETTFIDCAGLGALIAVRNLTRARNGIARLMNPTSSVQQMLDFTRTGQLFEIVNAPAADRTFGPGAHN